MRVPELLTFYRKFRLEFVDAPLQTVVIRHWDWQKLFQEARSVLV